MRREVKIMANKEEVKIILREEMNSRGWLDNDYRAGLAAIVGGESNFEPKYELGYTHTSNSRIRRIFPSRVKGMSDEELNAVKESDETWFNFVYGGEFGRENLGNIEVGDGFKFRGGGLNQLTGRDNYGRYGPKVGVDLLENPELINNPRVAAAVAVEYMKDRFKGGNFDDMKRAVGVSVGEPDAEKNRLYVEYMNNKEWDYDGEKVKEVGKVVESEGEKIKILNKGDIGNEVKELQTLLGGLDVDGNFGRLTHKRVRDFQKEKGLVSDGVVGTLTWKVLREKE